MANDGPRTSDHGTATAPLRRAAGTDGVRHAWQGGERRVGELTHSAEAGRGECELTVTGHDGLRAVEVIYEAYASFER
jgi:hypothetical protein